MAKKKSKRAHINSKKTIMLVSFLVAVICVFVYMLHEKMLSIFKGTTEGVYRTFGFIVSDISVNEQWIQKNIKIKNGDILFVSSAENIFRDVKSNLWVKDLIVHKSLPNKISVSVSRKKAVAVFQENSKFTLIDENGEDIECVDVKKLKDKIPIVAGEGARKEFWLLMKTISRYPTVLNKLNSVSYIRGRRWDLIVSEGITVKLPEKNINESLESLELLLRQPKFNKNTIKIIDLRVKDKVIFSGSKLEHLGEKNKKTV
ncbi:MAG: cell division protein FtsQ/DivIB [Holosporales bacterium]|nr:cell division protein FtsQ/DivIB [Holosporales bacterium]